MNQPPGINSGLTASGGIISDYTEGSALFTELISLPDQELLICTALEILIPDTDLNIWL